MSAQTSDPMQADETVGSCATGLRFLVFPLAVFVLANVLFALLAFDIPALVEDVKSLLSPASEPSSRFAEARARLSWVTTALLFYCTMAAMTAYCVRVIVRGTSGRKRVVIVAAGVVLMALLLAYLALSGRLRTNFSYIFYFTFDILVATGRYTTGELRAISVVISGLNVLAAVVPTLAIMSGCCVLSGRQGADRSELEMLETRMRRLKALVNMASALMVAGVLHMMVWLRWPAAFVDESEVSRSVEGLSNALGLYWGVTFSLLVATLYLPAAWSISRRAQVIFEASLQHSKGVEMRDWLQTHGLLMWSVRQTPQFVAISAPLLTEPVGTVVKSFVESAGGG